MINPYPYTIDNKRYQTWSYYLKERFGRKVYKVPLSLATTCPNRDGTKATGGCTFCLSGGGGVPYQPGDFSLQFATASAPLETKWPDSLALPYFQSYSNTYLPADILDSALNEALQLPKTVGICVATRPDCLPDDILDILARYSQKTFLMVELGLQTIHEATAKRINRGHTFSEFLEGYHKLVERGIPVCVHIINGLPYETPTMMLDTVRAVAKLNPHSVKFHMMHVLEGTALADEYKEQPFPLLTEEEYVSLLCDQLELLPPMTVIQRVTGDPPKEELLEPRWTLHKLSVRNSIDKELLRRDSFQGKYY